jgi:hypothetical protein
MKPPILFELNSQDTNIDTAVLNDFTKKIENTKSSGIFMSQKTGISEKPNFHIELYHGNVLVYIHNLEQHSAEKVRIAINIIDNLGAKLKEVNASDNKNIYIPKEVLDEINKEYIAFIHKKETVISIIKESNKKILAEIDDFQFPNLDKYLSTRFVVSSFKPTHKCDICNIFCGNNLKALAAHKRGCIRKNPRIAIEHTNRVIN